MPGSGEQDGNGVATNNSSNGWGGSSHPTVGRQWGLHFLSGPIHQQHTALLLCSPSSHSASASVFPCLFWFPSGSRKSCSQWTEGAWREWPLNEEGMAEEQCDSFWVIRITQDRLFNTGIEEAYLTSFPPKD